MSNTLEPLSAAEPVQTERKKAFTIRAILLGLLGVIFINAFTGFNDEHIHSTLFIGNHLPTGVFFIISLATLLWNPLAKLISTLLGINSEKLALSTRELAVSMTMLLAGSWTPSSGFYRYFQRHLILPWFKELTKTNWQKYGILEYLPKKLFPLPIDSAADNKLYETVYTGFVTGIASGDKVVWPWSSAMTSPIGDSGLSVWDAWAAPLAYWTPFMICFAVATIALSLLVHRQWAHHEQLSYPLASISTSIITRDKGRILPDIFYSKLFLWGAGAVLFIHMIKLGNIWYPQTIPGITLYWFLPLDKLFPSLNNCGGPVWQLKSGTLFFTIIGVSYFISSQIGLTMGISNILLVLILAQIYLATGKPVNEEYMEVQRGGSYLAYAIILIYTGRSYYWSVFSKAFNLKKGKDYEEDGIIAARLFTLSFAGFIAMLWVIGLDPLVAVLFGATTMMMFLVFTRIICESGVPFLQTAWQPGTFLAKVLGFSAIGAAPLTIIYWLSTILAQDPRECMMPYISTSLKIADDTKIKIRAVA
ncbi:MAG: hypothetical protein JXR97_09300, partial [Planctomycetes bacterium]|nr:hypothetical protein [Planctomycetota bacterium]